MKNRCPVNVQFNINHEEQMFVQTTGSGSFEFNLASLYVGPGTTISIDWGLVWNGDGAAGTTASVSNIDLATETKTAPVPVPATMLLFGTGLAGLAAVRRKKKHLQKT